MKNKDIQLNAEVSQEVRMMASLSSIIEIEKEGGNFDIKDMDSVNLIGLMAKEMAKPKVYNIITATHKGHLTGHIIYSPIKDGCSVRIVHLVVFNEYRRCGIGRALVKYVINDCKEKAISVAIRDKNKVAKSFWYSFGVFKKTRSKVKKETCLTTDLANKEPFLKLSAGRFPA